MSFSFASVAPIKPRYTDTDDLLTTCVLDSWCVCVHLYLHLSRSLHACFERKKQFFTLSALLLKLFLLSVVLSEQ